MEKKYFKNDAKTITDMLFDNKFFKDNMTRDNINVFEELIEFMLQGRFDSYLRAEKLFNDLKK